MEEKTKLYLEFIQAIITRLSSNSFQIKNFSIAINVGLLGFYANNQGIYFLLLLLVSTLSFWLLDAYYLQQERKYRSLFKDVISDKRNNFDMSVNEYKESFFRTFISKTLIFYYLFFTLVILLLFLINFCS
ncbi:hypothetical protein [Capnocytophaga canimorsus]|uniref:hypothetical protein n=1 Tax=Capnocytophaga canimorsus TaxID=28188 RepID=UPI00385F500A